MKLKCFESWKPCYCQIGMSDLWRRKLSKEIQTDFELIDEKDQNILNHDQSASGKMIWVIYEREYRSKKFYQIFNWMMKMRSKS